MYVHTFVITVGIEKEIHQKKFQSEYEKLLVNVMFTGGWVQTQHSELLRKFDLTVQQYNILRILKGQYPKPSTVNLLIERMLYKNSNASRLVDKLLAKGLVQRNTCPTDRRKAEVILSEQGMKILDEAAGTVIGLLKSIEVVSEEEAIVANQVLDRIRGVDKGLLS